MTSLSLKGAFETAAAESADTGNPLFVVRHRAHRKGARWRVVGRAAASWASAVALIDDRATGGFKLQPQEGECQSCETTA